MKKAKLHLEFGLGGAKLNLAISKDEQPRNAFESDWNLQCLELNSAEFELFPCAEKVNEEQVTKIAKQIDYQADKIANEYDCQFSVPIELSIASNFFIRYYVPIYPPMPFNSEKILTEEIIDGVRKAMNKYLDNMYTPDEKIKIIINDYFYIKEKDGAEYRTKDPIEKSVIHIGLDACIITIHPLISKLKESLENNYNFQKINISLSSENEFAALANKEEKADRTALINITDSKTEISIFENSILKTTTKSLGLEKFKEIIWKLCLFYHKHTEFILKDFEYLKDIEVLKTFYKKIDSISDISQEAMDSLSGRDCENLFNEASCILDEENSEGAKFRRLPIPQKNSKKSKITISNYVLSGFTIEAVSGIFSDIKDVFEKDQFCKPERILIECALPLQGIENLATEFFGIPARRENAKWNDETKNISAAGIGALNALISGTDPSKKSGTQKVVKKNETSFLKRIFSIFVSEVPNVRH